MLAIDTRPSENPANAEASATMVLAESPGLDTAPFQMLFDMAIRLGLALTESNGGLADASHALAGQAEAIHGVVAATQQMAQSNRAAADKLGVMGDSASEIGRKLERASSAIEKRIGASRTSVAHLASTAQEIDQQVTAAAGQVAELRKSSAGIQNVAREIQLLAINAGVEAARHGVSGRGFAVIAEAVKKLADQTRQSTEQTEKHLIKLAATMEQLQARGATNHDAARTADEAMTDVGGKLSDLMSAREAVAGFVSGVERAAAPLQDNVRACASILEGMKDGSRRVDSASADIAAAVERFDRLVVLGEGMSSALIGACDDLPVSNLVAACQNAAEGVAALFVAALKTGELRREQLFDERYRLIPGTLPQQHLTDFTTYADRVLPALQEPLLASDRRISFCAAVDRNGYLPTHNRRFSQPISDDPVWNAQNCRNRRIFNDRTGLASARNTNPILLQIYRRDMGGGEYVVMNELAAPILIEGRHWGAFRIGFRG